MGQETLISLVAMECKEAIGDATDVPEMLRRAFKAAKNHWMVLEPEPQLQGALAAVLTKLGEGTPEYERLHTEIEIIAKFNAWLRAAQMGVAGDPPVVPEGHEGYGVMKEWQAAA